MTAFWNAALALRKRPEAWDGMADEVMDVIGGRPGAAQPIFVKRLNEAMIACQVSLQVQSIGQLRAGGILDRQQAYQEYYVQIRQGLGQLFESIHQEPDRINLVVPEAYQEQVARRELKAQQDKYAAQIAEAREENVEPLPPSEPAPPTWDGTHEALLERPDLLDMLVAWGDAQVRDLTDVWRALWLGMASLFAPSIRQGEQVHRQVCDTLLIGEFSTAKTAMLKIILSVSPKGTYKTAFTPVAFSGRRNAEGDEVPGIARRANGGTLAVDELDKLLRRFPILDGLFRSLQTEGHLDYETTYGAVDYDSNVFMPCGANPLGDTFSDSAIRKQIPFAQGVLSRFAFIKTLAYTTAKVNNIGSFMADTWFTGAPVDAHALDVPTVRAVFAALYSKLREVRDVSVPRDGLRQVFEHFRELQEPDSVRPLLHTRDLESAFKWLNASVALHVAQRTVVDGVIHATQDDVDNALFMLDAMVASRKAMLSDTRAAVAIAPLERAYAIVHRELERVDSLDRQDLVDMLRAELGISQATAYRYITELSQRSDVRLNGLRNATVEATKTSA